MQLQSLACNQCGAALAIPGSAEFVTCNHCGTSLAVVRNESVTYTEQVHRIERRTDQISEQLAEIRYHDELRRIDEEWKGESARLSSPDERGRPAFVGAFVLSFVIFIFGFFMLADGQDVGILVILGAIAVGFIGFLNASAHEQAKQRYLARRNALSIDDFLPDDES